MQVGTKTLFDLHYVKKFVELTRRNVSEISLWSILCMITKHGAIKIVSFVSFMRVMEDRLKRHC